MSNATVAQWTDEGIWNAVFGPHETRESVVRTATDNSVTPQDFTQESITEAIAQGADFDRDAAFRSLCKQLEVAVG